MRLMRRIVRRRGLGQDPTQAQAQATVSPLPTCASMDLTQTLPQQILVGGGGLATLIGVAGAIFGGDEYRKDFAIAAGVGIVSSFIGGIWAVNTFQKNFLNPQCTGPGLTALDGMSVNPDQTTPTGMQPGLFGPTTPSLPQPAPAPAQTQTA